MPGRKRPGSLGLYERILFALRVKLRDMIHVLATITVKPGKRAEFIKAFHGLMPSVHAEAGCLAYAPSVDVASGHPGQPAVRENVVVVVEQWESVKHLAAHSAAPHMAAFFGKHGSLVESVSLVVTEPA